LGANRKNGFFRKSIKNTCSGFDENYNFDRHYVHVHPLFIFFVYMGGANLSHKPDDFVKEVSRCDGPSERQGFADRKQPLIAVT